MEKAVIKKLSILLFACFVVSFSFGQQVTPPLERIVTISFESVLIKDALIQIEDKTNCSFAYKTGVFDEKMQINRAYINKSVREILDDVFQGNILASTKGNYILLKKNPSVKSDELTIEGYVFDAYSKEKIPYATIYESQTLSSAVSDEYGHYILKLSAENTSSLIIKKNEYEDKNITFVPTESRIVSIALNPITKTLDSSVIVQQNDSIDFVTRLQHLKWLRFSKERKANMTNFKEFIQQKAQISFLPTLGTNGKLSSATTVNHSFNVLGGIVGGVRTFELAGLFNIDVDSVKFVQIAGLFNVVGGQQTGLQIGGLFNSNLSSFKGVQISGLSNFVNKEMFGLQISGLTNKVKDNQFGTQIAGIVNFNQKNSSGVSIAGISNITIHQAKGIQIGGISNHAAAGSTVSQISGIANTIGKNSLGLQIAGIANYSLNHFKGTQVSGIINLADTIEGFQIGFINYSRHIKGIPIGFLSFSKSGIHQLELATTESLPIQIGLRTGVKAFYNNLFLTGKFSSNDAILGLGYGIGTTVYSSKKQSICTELQSVFLTNSSYLDDNYLYKLAVTYQYNFKDKFALSVGPTLNFLVINDIHANESSKIAAISPYQFYDKTTIGGQLKQAWVGGILSIRLF